MDILLSWAHGNFHYLVESGILILEFFGTMVLIVTGVKSMIGWIKHSIEVREWLAQGILLALAFKMGGEVLRTVIVEDTTELFLIFAIILLRGIVAALVYWELGKEKKLEQDLTPGSKKARKDSGAAEEKLPVEQI